MNTRVTVECLENFCKILQRDDEFIRLLYQTHARHAIMPAGPFPQAIPVGCRWGRGPGDRLTIAIQNGHKASVLYQQHYGDERLFAVLTPPGCDPLVEETSALMTADAPFYGPANERYWEQLCHQLFLSAADVMQHVDREYVDAYELVS